MNEHKCSQKLRTALQKAGLIAWKLNLRYLIGVPDLVVIGKHTVWVEVKYLKSLPKRSQTIIKPNLSKPQLLTCNLIYKLGGAIVVLVYTPNGVIAYDDPLAWTNGVTKENARLMKHHDVVDMLFRRATGGPTMNDVQHTAQKLKAVWDIKKSQLGMTQAEAAAKLGITQSALAQYLLGYIPANTDFILKFSKLLGVDPTIFSPDLAELLPQPNDTGFMESYELPTNVMVELPKGTRVYVVRHKTKIKANTIIPSAKGYVASFDIYKGRT